MAYLLDTNILIQAKNEYYGFDVCPGFWDWLTVRNSASGVFSIEPVFKELQKTQDELAVWASDRQSAFFLPLDAPANAAMSQVAAVVQRGGFKPHAVHEFMKGADPFVIAYAMAHKITVVTHEVHIPGAVRKVRIPTICKSLNVPCVRTFDMLRSENVRFVLA